MANAILLQSGALRDFQPLGAEGNPVYQAAPQLRAAIKRKLGDDVADLFAIPQRSEDGNRIDWYAPHEGLVVPWSSATPEEQHQGKQKLLAARKRINEIGCLMQAEQESEHKVFGRLLEHVTSIPNEGHVQLVNGQPVLTFWGFHERDAQLGHDALSLLPVMEPDASVATAAGNVPVVSVDAARRRRFRWWWLWLPLLLLLLALLAFSLLRGCAPEGLPGMGLPDHTPEAQEELPADKDRLAAERDVVDADTGSIISPNTETLADDEAHALDELPKTPDEPFARSDESPVDESPADESPADESPADEPPADESPVDKSPADESPVDESPPDEVVNKSLPTELEAPAVPQESGEPLVIPPEAIESGSTDFLNGRWSADSGLMDRSGRPVDVEYEFKQGKGVARYQRSNGVVCEGPTSAAMNGDRLVITDSDNIVCQDGVRFRKSHVECKVADSGLADCAGSYVTGDRFSVGMKKVRNK